MYCLWGMTNLTCTDRVLDVCGALTKYCYIPKSFLRLSSDLVPSITPLFNLCLWLLFLVHFHSPPVSMLWPCPFFTSDLITDLFKQNHQPNMLTWMVDFKYLFRRGGGCQQQKAPHSSSPFRLCFIVTPAYRFYFTPSSLLDSHFQWHKQPLGMDKVSNPQLVGLRTVPIATKLSFIFAANLGALGKRRLTHQQRRTLLLNHQHSPPSSLPCS